MAFTNHQITAFQKKLTDLPDQPNLSAAELKAYFDSSPEELRQALNGVCTDAERLDSRVSGIVAETFGDSIPKTMLTTELQKEIDAKAEESAVAARLEAEQAARESADEILNQTVAQKCEVHFGTYTGDGAASQFIDLGFTPKAVFSITCAGLIGGNSSGYYGGLTLPGYPAGDGKTKNAHLIVENGFMVYKSGTNTWEAASNERNVNYHFIAFR